MRKARMVMDQSTSGEAEKHPLLHRHATGGDYKQQSIQDWLNSNYTSLVYEDRPPSPQEEEIMQRMNSTEDDLMLGVEAMIYPSSIQNMSFKEFVSAFHSEKHPPTRMNSLASMTSLNIGPKSVFEFLNRWHSDPEELLLDLGFGKEEPDISTKIPARFINSCSVATGINIGVFLEAQKSRMEMEILDICKITTQNVSSELNNVQMQPVDTKTEPTALLRSISQRNPSIDIQDSQKPEENCGNNENTLSTLGRERKYAFLCAHTVTPQDDSIMSQWKVEQNEDQRKAPGLSLDLKTAQDYPLPEASAKDKDFQFQMLHAKKLKHSMCDQLPESFEIEEVKSFDEDSSPGIAANKNCSDIKRENSCQSESSGFLEEPFIPPQIPNAFKSVGCDRINSQDPFQEKKQWPTLIKDLGQATCNITEQTWAPVSDDCDQAKFSEAATELQVSQEENSINMETIDVLPHTFGDQLGIAVPCVDKVTGEKSELNDNQNDLPMQALKDDFTVDERFWENNQIHKENSDVHNQNNDPVCSKAVNVNYSKTQQESSLHVQHPAALSKVVTTQSPQEKLQQRSVTEVCSLEPVPLLFQSDEDSSENSEIKECSKMREASVQTEDNTEEFTIEPNKYDQVRNPSLLVPDFQTGRQFRRSVSVDTGLHIIEQNAQKLTAITPTHCCRQCYCYQHHCSAAWLKGDNVKCPPKTSISPSEAQLIKTLQQLQETTKVISGSPAIQEIDSMKQCLQSFQNTLVDIEQDIIEDQGSVDIALTEEEREDVRWLQKLHQAVREEVKELEVLLEDRARQFREAMKTRLLSLLDEQSSVNPYQEVLKQTGDVVSDSQLCPSSVCTTSAPAAVTNFDQLESNPGTSLSMYSMLRHSLVSSAATSTSNQTDPEARSEAVKDTELIKNKHHQKETLEFRTILRQIKQSFQQFRLVRDHD
ncbi:protein ITPRID1 [Mobula hypostoma]|uniref:protein ITPRID1 n=1 Tax=Mobula hypostoma TaxID=723540 RepID=UPI002FC2BB07